MLSWQSAIRRPAHGARDPSGAGAGRTGPLRSAPGPWWPRWDMSEAGAAMDAPVSTDWLAGTPRRRRPAGPDRTVILEAGRGGWLPGGLGPVALGRGPHPRLRLRRPDRRPVRPSSPLRFTLPRPSASPQRWAPRCGGAPGSCSTTAASHVGRPAVVDAAGVRLRRRRRARRRLAGLDRRAGRRRPRRSPFRGRCSTPGPARACSSTATRSSPARRRRHLPPQRPVRGAAPGRGVRLRRPGHLPGSRNVPAADLVDRTPTATSRPRRSGRASARSSTTRRWAASSPIAGVASPRRPTRSRSGAWPPDVAVYDASAAGVVHRRHAPPRRRGVASTPNKHLGRGSR